MTWFRWLLPDRLLQPGAFSKWANTAIREPDWRVVIAAGVLGLVCAGAAAPLSDNPAEGLLGALVYGPLVGWCVVYILTNMWHWILSRFVSMGSIDRSFAATTYGLAPLAWLAILGAAMAMTTGWGLHLRIPETALWGVMVMSVAWVMWLMVTTMSRMQSVSFWLAAATLLPVGLIMVLPVGVAYYSVALPIG